MSDNVYLSIFIIFFMWAVIKASFQKSVRTKREIKEYPVKLYIDKVASAVQRMNGHEFEEFVGYIFSSLGYETQITSKSRDGGKDLILGTGKGKIYVEVKRYAENNLISSPLILKLVGSAANDGVSKCIFLTTSGYTKDAIETAERSKINIDLLDYEGFIDLCKECKQDNILTFLGY